MAIYLTFNEWLSKRVTFANWGCGIDLTLNTIIIKKEFMHKNDKIIEDEEKYRRLMTIYALNDCLSVTQLTQKIKIKRSLTTSTTIYENIPDDEQIIKFKNRWIYVHLINLMIVQKFMHQMEF